MRVPAQKGEVLIVGLREWTSKPNQERNDPGGEVMHTMTILDKVEDGTRNGRGYTAEEVTTKAKMRFSDFVPGVYECELSVHTFKGTSKVRIDSIGAKVSDF